MGFFETLAGSDYADAMRRHLPRGKIWRAISAAFGIAQVNDGLGPELSRAHNRLLDVLEEADPQTTTELLPGWERILDLPDPCDPSPPVTIADRRLLAHAKLIARGGLQKPIIQQVILAAGYDSTEIQIPTLFRADESASGERLYDDTYALVWFVWRATTPAQGWERLQCVLDDINFSFSDVGLIDGLRANEVPTEP